MTTIHDLMFGQTREDRPCGDCIACCQVLNIDEPELVKPQGRSSRVGPNIRSWMVVMLPAA